MLLIDACNVKTGGTLVLLHYLINRIKKTGCSYKIIVNKTVANQFDENIIIFDTTYLKRDLFINSLLDIIKPEVFFCYGNFAPLKKYIHGKTIVYVHHPYYPLTYKKSWLSYKNNLLMYLKSKYFKYTSRNANLFIFQTNVVKDSYKSKFKLEEAKCMIIPFYDSEQMDATAIQNIVDTKENAFIYVSSSDPHKNHKVLFRAWEKLYDLGYLNKLYVTLPPSSHFTPPLLKEINKLKRGGVQIENLGTLPYKDILAKVASVRFCIFPSLMETLGLGLVEALKVDTQVLMSNIDCLQEVVKPSASFDPEHLTSIVDSVIRVLTTEVEVGEVIIKNDIQKLLRVIC